MPVRTSRAVFAVVVVSLAIGACTDDDDAATTTPSAVAARASGPATTAPADDDFCRAMVSLGDRITGAAGTEVVDDVIGTYTELVPIAPVEISEELAAVLDRLQTERAGEELDDPTRAIADEAATRVSAWVDLNCRGVANNPGPPATAPP